jgi:antitoxin ParD1/3/4
MVARAKQMATMNVSLPASMRAWVEAQTESGRYASPSDYVCNLIRRDQARSGKIIAMQRLVDEGLNSGVDSRSSEELFAAALAR